MNNGQADNSVQATSQGPNVKWVKEARWVVDGNVWTFKLRPNVKFSDGSPFTAEDVVFTYDRVPKVPNNRAERRGGIFRVRLSTVIDQVWLILVPQGCYAWFLKRAMPNSASLPYWVPKRAAPMPPGAATALAIRSLPATGNRHGQTPDRLRSRGIGRVLYGHQTRVPPHARTVTRSAPGPVAFLAAVPRPAMAGGPLFTCACVERCQLPALLPRGEHASGPPHADCHGRAAEP